MNGVARIEASFAAARPGTALMPYFTLGYPTASISLQIVQSIAQAGADLIELGIPFSDPLADGPTIQRSTQISLAQGTNVEGCLELTAQLRACGIMQPLLLMGYINPLLSYGIERFVEQAAAAGADGFIVPDLPPEEAYHLEAASHRHGCALVYMLSPTSTESRIAQAADRSRGFIYLVSLTGTTGARQRLPGHLEAFTRRVRAHTTTPLAVGFGISTPQQARSVGRFADGVIVGSALIDAVSRVDKSRAPETAAALVRRMRRALSLLSEGE